MLEAINQGKQRISSEKAGPGIDFQRITDTFSTLMSQITVNNSSLRIQLEDFSILFQSFMKNQEEIVERQKGLMVGSHLISYKRDHV